MEKARTAVSMIVGRDTAVLSEEAGLLAAAVKVVAGEYLRRQHCPIMLLLLGGPVAGFVWRAVNTMIPMLGHKNEKYMYFEQAASPPGRRGQLHPLPSGGLGHDCSLPPVRPGCRGGIPDLETGSVLPRQPHLAQTESVCAGALGVALAGDAVYFGKTVKKSFIGDARRRVEAEDIVRANWLLYVSAGIIWLAGLLLRWTLCGGWGL